VGFFVFSSFGFSPVIHEKAMKKIVGEDVAKGNSNGMN
jgi:hypothetical protein